MSLKNMWFFQKWQQRCSLGCRAPRTFMPEPLRFLASSLEVIQAELSARTDVGVETHRGGATHPGLLTGRWWGPGLLCSPGMPCWTGESVGPGGAFSSALEGRFYSPKRKCALATLRTRLLSSCTSARTYMRQKGHCPHSHWIPILSQT